MKENIDELNKKLNELAQKPIKTKQEIALRQEVLTAIEKALCEEEIELVNELKSTGLEISSVWDLINIKESYPEAVPILIKHLQKKYHEKNKEGIVRALAVKDAIGKASPPLLYEYSKIPKDKMMLRWAIGNTIYITITENDVDEILPIVQDKSNGMSRQMFVAALGKVKSEKAESILISLLDDEEVIIHSLKALVSLKSKKAKDKISMLINHPKAIIKKEALKALKKIC